MRMENLIIVVIVMNVDQNVDKLQMIESVGIIPNGKLQ